MREGGGARQWGKLTGLYSRNSVVRRVLELDLTQTGVLRRGVIRVSFGNENLNELR